MSNKLVLLDGNSILFRAFYALPLLNNDKGVYTNAVYGFTTMLLKILEEEKPSHMLVAFDAGKTTFRHEAYKEYKGGRQKTPPELSEQFPITKELLDAFHIPHYELNLYEADDIIGTLAIDGAEKDWDVKVISGDQDLLQLVSEKITVDLTRKGISEVDSYNPETMVEKMEISPEQIIDLKALMGDNSDNIPGVPGVGIKTATRLLKEYGTLESVYDQIDQISGKKLKENLLSHKEDAFLSKELVTINCKSPIQVSLEKLKYDGYKEEAVYDIFNSLGFQSLLDRLGMKQVSEEIAYEALEYTVVEEVTDDMFTGEEVLMLEMLDENYHQANIEAIGILNEHANYIVPTEVALASNSFKKWAEDKSSKKFVFDAKSTYVSLRKNNIHIEGITFDMLLATYLINPAERHDSVSTIAHRFGYRQVKTDEEVYGKGAKKKVPAFEVLAEHVVRKCHSILTLKDDIKQKLADAELTDLYDDLELPLALILGEMEATGVKVDIQKLEEMKVVLKERLEKIEEEAYEIAGETFNLNSPKQLGTVLFEKLQLPVIKKTKTGYSTAADVLEKLEDQHEIIPKIILYRQLGKLQSTYIEGLIKVTESETHKIHTRFNQALTQTGRLSSIEPNLQNIPIRLEEGRKIRQAFIPSHEDWVIFSADYSQIELRVLAHIANDEKLVTAFQEDRDIHRQTAADVFHVSHDEVTSVMRDQSKAVNFGIVYGMSDYGLSQNLNITRKEAGHFIDRYFESYPGVKAYMDEIVQEAKHKGYVTTIMNRRRYLPEITSRNFNQRSFAERTAMNTPIQGSAADIIKKAMIDLHAALLEEKLEAKILLQVHDELILEAPKSEVEQLEKIVPAIMEHTVELSVPLKVDYTYGKSWFDAQ